MIRRIALLSLLLAALLPAVARADGDPGSDVLVYENYFSGPAAGLSTAAQAQLGDLLTRAAAAGFPVRVAIIGGPADLGSLGSAGGAWRKPQAYSAFLATELANEYAQRLVVVMPNGIGFYWYAHPAAVPAGRRALAAVHVGSGPAGLAAAAMQSVRALAAAAGAKLNGRPAAAASAARTPAVLGNVAPTGSGAPRILSTGGGGHSTDDVAGVVALILLALAGAAAGGRTVARRRRLTPVRATRTRGGGRGPVPALAGAGVVIGIGLIVALLASGSGSGGHPSALATSAELDPGTALGGAAPNFSLTDESDHRVSLSDYRGKVVMLAFNDAVCTTLCPITTQAMVDARAMLGRAAGQVQLLGVEANPHATSLADVASYTTLHGLTGQWHFLTGSVHQLLPVWTAYHVAHDVEKGLVSHTAAIFMITPQGREAEIYLTHQSYASIGQFGQILAREAARLLPGHPTVDSHLSYATASNIGPTDTVSLPRSGGGRVTLGPGHDRLQVFFATWDQEVTGIGAELSQLNAYVATERRQRLPALIGVDEGAVEPSAAALPRFLHGLSRPLGYPVAIDATGRVADGYEVQGQPWFVLTSPSGQILWHWEVDTQGWPGYGTLVTQIRAALATGPGTPITAAQVRHDLSGSPAPLATLHDQADRILGDDSAMMARIRALHGTPIVINVWASSCAPCQDEFGLLARASAQYGRRVAFIGADYADSPANARTFLAQHPVSYPSYEVGPGQLSSLIALDGTPTTIFINSTGKVEYIHLGEYDSQGTLDDDVESNAS